MFLMFSFFRRNSLLLAIYLNKGTQFLPAIQYNISCNITDFSASFLEVFVYSHFIEDNYENYWDY